jgi:hypothetical protein
MNKGGKKGGRKVEGRKRRRGREGMGNGGPDPPHFSLGMTVPICQRNIYISLAGGVIPWVFKKPRLQI